MAAGGGSSTTPPPRVSGGAIERTTTRSPGAASSGCSQRSWQAGRRARRSARRTRACRGGRARASRARVAQVELAVEHVGRRAPRRARRPRRRARRRAVDAGEVEGDALAGAGALDRLVVDLHRAHPHRACPPGAARRRSPGADRARPQRARSPPCPAPRMVKARSTCSSGSPSLASRPRQARRRRVEGRAHLLDAGAGARRARHDRGLREQLAPPRAARAPGRRGRPWSPRRRRAATPRAASTAACSRVWGITPSSAATTIR